VEDEGSGTFSALDVGCGNGRFAGFLEERLAERLDYLGLDSSEALLEEASATHAAHPHIRFQQLELIDPPADRGLPAGPFELVALFGVLHHVPGFDAREALLGTLLSRLSESGRLVVTAWQFGAHERFRRRIVSFESYNETATQKLDPDELEPGDHLLRWREEALLRYCHYCDAAELERLLERLPVRVVDAFSADGKSDDLNRYLILAKA
jgi:SAM-dependent methyltransferase